MREARITNVRAPKKRAISVCARVGCRAARSVVRMKIRTKMACVTAEMSSRAFRPVIL